MKRIFFLTALCLTFLNGMAQQTTPKLSPSTQRFLKDQQNQTNLKNYVYKKTADGKMYVSALIKVSDANLAQSGLSAIGAQVGTKAGRIWTVRVPVDQVKAFSLIKGIQYIQIDEPVKPQLNVVRTVTRTDSVQKGINLPRKYSGKNVVMGVIDFGFDYKHPSFYDTTGTRYRVRKVWELNGVGTPPAGYTFGRELKDSNQIKAEDTDNSEQTHGTCVAGVAAGSGFGSLTNGTRCRGMAYNTDLVFVGVRRDSNEQQWLEGGFSDFVDGINYIFNYAASVHKPAVVNISWGSHSGPHDGTSLFNEACDNLTGSGRIIVMSAGNEGDNKLHISKTFTEMDTIMHTFLSFTPKDYQRTWVDTWGEIGKTFCAQVTLYNNGQPGNTTGMVCIDDQMHSFQLIGSAGNDTCEVQFTTTSAEYNDKPRITINLFNHTADSIGISFGGTNGTIHAWDEYYYYGYTHSYQSSFTNNGYAWAQDGNTETTVSDMGSAQSVVLVGAYSSKVSWKDLNNNTWTYGGYATYGEITPFSSRGPMIDGRIKPDITAPGLTMATSYSSYDADYVPGGKDQTKLVSSYTNPQSGRTYYYGEFIGTSASSPVASGIVALMLEANPSLFPSHVHKILAESAIVDSYTGTVPNNTWGNGKINAYGAVKGALATVGMAKVEGDKLDCMVYPNPTNGSFTLDYISPENQNLQIEIFDITAQRVLSQNWTTVSGLNSKSFDISMVPQGLYLVKVQSNEGSSTMRLLIQ